MAISVCYGFSPHLYRASEVYTLLCHMHCQLKDFSPSCCKPNCLLVLAFMQLRSVLLLCLLLIPAPDGSVLP